MLPVLDDYNFPSVPSGNQDARNLTHFCTYCNCLKEPVQDKVKNNFAGNALNLIVENVTELH